MRPLSFRFSHPPADRADGSGHRHTGAATVTAAHQVRSQHSSSRQSWRRADIEGSSRVSSESKQCRREKRGVALLLFMIIVTQNITMCLNLISSLDLLFHLLAIELESSMVQCSISIGLTRADSGPAASSSSHARCRDSLALL